MDEPRSTLDPAARLKIEGLAAAAPPPVLRTLEVSGAPHPELPSGVEVALYRLSILAAATFLIWAIEVAGRSSPPP